MTTLNNKIVWITGASGGIGEAMALAAVKRGANVILTARREAELERVAQACGGSARAKVLPLDLLNFDADAAYAQAKLLFGQVDILVNNAGLSQRGTVLNTEMATYRTLFELDFFATIALTKAVLGDMQARKSGHVVTVSSVVGYISSPLRSGYAAAKHALHGFFDAAAAELHNDQVRFTLACPGYVKTQVSVNALSGDGSQHGKMDAGQEKGLSAETCAEKIWRGVEKNKYEVMVGKESLVIYVKRFFPSLYAAIIRRIDFS